MLRLQGVSSSIAPFKKKLVNAPFQKVGPLPFYSTRKLHIVYKKFRQKLRGRAKDGCKSGHHEICLLKSTFS